RLRARSCVAKGLCSPWFGRWEGRAWDLSLSSKAGGKGAGERGRAPSSCVQGDGSCSGCQQKRRGGRRVRGREARPALSGGRRRGGRVGGWGGEKKEKSPRKARPGKGRPASPGGGRAATHLKGAAVMNEDTAFLRAIVADPKDDAARLVYADWLEEHGDPRAEFLRVDCALAGMKPNDQRYEALQGRLRQLSETLDAGWLTVVSRPPIENCGLRFKFRCPKKWDQLKSTGDDAQRFCETCRKTVYYCDSIEEGRRHAWQGDCIAIDLRVER